MEGNRRINGDIYAGVFMITAEDGTDGAKDLSDEQIQRYTKMFEADENYTQDEVEDSIHMTFICLD
ncbi:MAG: hypothetical protein A2Y17_10475 [Clostridiales bacterium GWF2_38_85]|nr:MAG: hypothetical protein A2Y17_10475 [Clostridiales bacterium GWF2_38_85]